ncbi:hypothetical protein LAZ67_X003639 [Cordylochernes scorpioides]|uniref:Uncharacterized protein n=1 Tax=Cordylochernes scorpioides TaxID=51811 RepID=A0ABY6LZ54_9ARAC|nr:hypothetical protein LAZ67_X003639 [Cordylochernes scorpioides]
MGRHSEYDLKLTWYVTLLCPKRDYILARGRDGGSVMKETHEIVRMTCSSDRTLMAVSTPQQLEIGELYDTQGQPPGAQMRVNSTVLVKDTFTHLRIFMPCRKEQSSFDQVSEFDRGRIVAYRDCGLSSLENR